MGSKIINSESKSDDALTSNKSGCSRKPRIHSDSSFVNASSDFDSELIIFLPMAHYLYEHFYGPQIVISELVLPLIEILKKAYKDLKTDINI